MNKSAVRKKQYVNDNGIESFKGLGKALVNSFSSDVAKGTATDVARQLEPFFGIHKGEQNGHKELSGDLAEGQELILTQINKNQVDNREKVPALDIAPGIDYRREILDGGKKILRENTQLVQRQIEEILVEIKKLSFAQKELELEFGTMVVQQQIVSPGKYHLNFFEWLLSVIRLARKKVEDSSSWLATFHSKKSKREYWAMFKKHGTTFGLSNERVVATQTG